MTTLLIFPRSPIMLNLSLWSFHSTVVLTTQSLKSFDNGKSYMNSIDSINISRMKPVV